MSEVEITLNGKTETLRCTLRAARKLNTGGGFTDVYRKLAALDLDAYIAVVAVGLDKKPADVEEAVFATGMPDLVEPLSNYVTLLANGGRPLKTTETDESGEA